MVWLDRRLMAGDRLVEQPVDPDGRDQLLFADANDGDLACVDEPVCGRLRDAEASGGFVNSQRERSARRVSLHGSIKSYRYDTYGDP